jgi:hypothetical protein
MERDEFFAYLHCFDLPRELVENFRAHLKVLKRDHDSFMARVRAYHESHSRLPFPDKNSWKSSREYSEMTGKLEFLRLVRLEYLTALKSTMKRDNLPMMCWETIIEDMTGGKIKFPEEIPALSTDKFKERICGLNHGKKTKGQTDYEEVRTGLDMIGGYLLRIDRVIGDYTLKDLVRHKIINPS